MCVILNAILHFSNVTYDIQNDAKLNLDTSLCCIDALPKASRRQYNTSLILRELNKAYIGFKPIITGHLDNESHGQSQANIQAPLPGQYY